MHGRGQHAQDLEHHRGADQRGVAGWVERRRHLDDVAADEVETVEAADHALRLGRREAADLRRAGSRRIDRVEPVDVEADIDRAVADDPPRLGDHLIRAEPEEFLDMDDADAGVLGPILLVGRIHRAADADLDHPLRVDQPLLDGAAERRAMGIFLAAEIAVAGVGMGVEMHDPDRPLAGDRAQDRQGDEMIAAGRQRRRSGGVQRGKEALDPLQRVGEVDRIDRRIAMVADPAQLIRRDKADVMHPAHQRRHVADFARAVPRAGPVRRAAVPRHPAERDVELSPGRARSAAA